MKKVILALILCIGIFTTGCGPNPTPSPSLSLSVSGDTLTTTGGAVVLKGSPNDNNASVSWASVSGSFDRNVGQQVVWNAPATSGSYIITATASIGSKSITKSITVNVKDSPLLITNKTLTTDIIGGQNANITVKNTSGKTVNAFRVKICMWNAFGEQVDYLGEYPFKGQATNITILPNNAYTATWSLYWASGVSRITPWVYEIAYTDGSTWKLE